MSCRQPDFFYFAVENETAFYLHWLIITNLKKN